MGASGMGHGYARVLSTAARYDVATADMRPRTEAPLDQQMLHLFGEAIRIEDWASHDKNPFTDERSRKSLPRSASYAAYAAANPLADEDLTAWRDPRFADSDVSLHSFLKSQGWTDDQVYLGAGINMGYGSSEFDLSVMMMFQNLRWLRYQSSVAPGRGGLAIAGGNQRLPEAMRNAVRGDVVMGARAVAIESSDDGVAVRTQDNQVHRARFLVCTLPFSALRLLSISPVLQGDQAAAVANLGYTPSVQIHYVPTKKYWELDELPAEHLVRSIVRAFHGATQQPGPARRSDQPYRVHERPCGNDAGPLFRKRCGCTGHARARDSASKLEGCAEVRKVLVLDEKSARRRNVRLLEARTNHPLRESALNAARKDSFCGRAHRAVGTRDGRRHGIG